jgi:hypothetical protein
VLAPLLLQAGQPVSLSRIVDALRPGGAPSSAVNIVHRHVGNLRKLLEPHLAPRAPGRLLVRRVGGYAIDVNVGTLDLLRFRELAQPAPPGPAASRGPPPNCSPRHCRCGAGRPRRPSSRRPATGASRPCAGTPASAPPCGPPPQTPSGWSSRPCGALAAVFAACERLFWTANTPALERLVAEGELLRVLGSQNMLRTVGWLAGAGLAAGLSAALLSRPGAAAPGRLAQWADLLRGGSADDGSPLATEYGTARRRPDRRPGSQVGLAGHPR